MNTSSVLKVMQPDRVSGCLGKGVANRSITPLNSALVGLNLTVGKLVLVYPSARERSVSGSKSSRGSTG